MRRRRCLAGLAAWGAASAGHADPSPSEQARIDRLIRSIRERKDALFIRNGREYSCAQAAEFLQGKLKWQIDRIATVHDFIDRIGSRSDTSGDIYRVRLADGRVVSSADFLRGQLAHIERR